VNRILRLREDPRFKNVGPDVLELNLQTPASSDPSTVDNQPGLWFDWPFVEFLKNHYGALIALFVLIFALQLEIHLSLFIS
jgi:hypothetical protein